MSLYLRWGGGIILTVAALLLCRGYEKYLMRRVAETEGLVLLISHAKGMISRFLSYGGELWQGFDNDALESCGLLASLRSGLGIKAAFDGCSPKMCLSQSARGWISAALDRLGKDYREGELRLLEEIESRLRTDAESERSSAEKNIKVARALLLGGALALLIMLI